MIVAREIANTGGISIYPLVDAASSQSGFYAPMTHPPVYVSLLYFFGAKNFVDQVPIIGQRMVSLWFFYSSCFALFALTSHRNVFRGLLSILLFVSMPLALLGATASLIDPLFISSTGIVVILMVSFPLRELKSSWLLVGIALGLSLWSHSQSILLFPIFAATFFIFNGVVNFKNSAIVLLKIFILALLIISPAYINSTISLGSPVSDNPPVFALASLEWSTWFEFNRGLYTNISKFQYGVFKGFFAPEAYGLTYVFAAISTIILMINNRSMFAANIYYGAHYRLTIYRKALYVSGLVLSFYFLGIILSVFIGTDLMIKNERYFLLVAFPAAVVSSWLISSLSARCISFSRSGTPPLLRPILLLSFLFSYFIYIFSSIMVSSLPVLSRLFRYYEADRLSSVLDSPNPAKEDYSSFSSIRFLDKLGTKVDTVFSFRPSDMFYSNSRMISYLDARLLPLYAMKSVDKALLSLRSLGVSHLQIPSYSIPVIYNSIVMDVLADTGASELVFEAKSGDQVYKLSADPSVSSLSCQSPVDLLKSINPWKVNTSYSILGRKSLDLATLSRNAPEWKGNTLLRKNPWFQRHTTHSLYSPVIPVDAGLNDTRDKLMNQIKLSVNLSGTGVMKIYRVPVAGDFKSVLIGDIPVSSSDKSIVFRRRFVQPSVPFYLEFQFSGQTAVKLNSVLIQSCS
jgi:hypothetical protein